MEIMVNNYNNKKIEFWSNIENLVKNQKFGRNVADIFRHF